MTQFLHWTPRVLGIALGLFVGVFALDVFSEGRASGEALAGFLLHLIPAAIVLAAVAAAWRWELIGGAIFLGLAVAYVLVTGGRQPWSAYALLSGIPAVLGILFLLDWLHGSQMKARV
jgi:hypothetical protein